MSRAALLPFFSPREIIPPSLAAVSEGFSHRSPIYPHPGLAGPPPRCLTFATLLHQAKCKGLRPAGGAGLGTELRGTGAAEPELLNRSSPGGSRAALGEPQCPSGATISLLGAHTAPRDRENQHFTGDWRECKTSIRVPAREGGQRLPRGRVRAAERCFGPKFPGNLC